MSTTMFVLALVAVYLLLGIGTARLIFTHQYKKHFQHWRARSRDSYSVHRGEDPHRLIIKDEDVWVPTIAGGILWPFGLAWMVILRPLGTVVMPMFMSWFTGPARTAVKRGESA